MRTLLGAAAIAVGFSVLGALDEPAWGAAKRKPTRVSFVMRGAHCDEDVRVLRKALRKTKDIRFKAERISAGEKPRYMTPPFIVELLDIEKTDVGALAESISKAKTPHAKEFAPTMNLVLYSRSKIDEDSVIALRNALRNVNGVEVLEPGGSGAVPSEGYHWVQLEDAGGAALAEILSAAEKATIEVSTRKP